MIREFKNAEYGIVKATMIEKKPYFCLLDITKMMGIQNSTECKENIPSKDIESVEVLHGNKKVNKLFIKAKHISTCATKSKKAATPQINDWLYRIVLPQLLNYEDYDIDKYYENPEKIFSLIDAYQDVSIRNCVLETENKDAKKKIKFINKLIGSAECIDLDMAIHVMKYKGISLQLFYKTLRDHGVLDENNQPYQEYCDKRYFRLVEAKVVYGGNTIISCRTYVFKSGITFIENILKSREVKRLNGTGKAIHNSGSVRDS